MLVGYLRVSSARSATHEGLNACAWRSTYRGAALFTEPGHLRRYSRRAPYSAALVMLSMTAGRSMPAVIKAGRGAGRNTSRFAA